MICWTLLSDCEAAQQFHQFQRFVEAGGNAAAGDAVAIDDKTGMTLDYFDCWKPLQAKHEGPMSADLISIEQARRGQEEGAFTNGRDPAGLPAARNEEIETGAGGIVHHVIERRRVPSGHPQDIQFG